MNYVHEHLPPETDDDGTVWVFADFTIHADTRGQTGTVDVLLEWYPHDPLAVRAFFASGDDIVEWVWSRDLLHHGLTRRFGAGDVRVQPIGMSVGVELDTPSGHAVLTVNRFVMAAFLNCTFRQCPQGHEYTAADVDTALDQWLREAA